ncbi:MAG: hypothetical protein ACE5JD_00770 [Candidatus Methylomirabilia bacterium]
MELTAPSEWGRRLSDRIRTALDEADFETARRLALEGDGQARSLEKEYTLMYKGLGITLRVLLELLGETARSQPAVDRDSAVSALVALLLRFMQEMGALLRQVYAESLVVEAVRNVGDARSPTLAADLEHHLAATAHLLSSAERVFAQEQARLATETVRAIEAREVAQARGVLDQKERGQYVPLHDRMVRFMAEVFSYILEHFGPAELYRFHRATAERQRRGFESWERLAPSGFAQASVFLLKQHMGTVAVREDDEKYTVVQTPCGSGGRLKLGGAYSGPRALRFVEELGPLTLGQERFPVYCSHCPIWNGVAPIEWFGRPHWVFEDPSRADGSCTLHIYKRRDAAPATYYRRLGLGEAGSGG